MQTGKARNLKICEDFGKMREWRFKRPQKTLHREKLYSQVPKRRRNMHFNIQTSLTCTWHTFLCT